MTVLKVVGVLLGIMLVIAMIMALEQYVNEKYNRSILNGGSIGVFILVEIGSIYAYYSGPSSMGADNFYVLIVILAILSIGVLISNMINMGFAGFFVTIVQSVAAVLIIIVLFLINDALNKKKR